MMEQSLAYKESVAKGTLFQKTKKSWAGNDSKNYISVVQKLVNKHNAKSLLDYGCGKGHQYTNPIKDLKPFNAPCCVHTGESQVKITGVKIKQLNCFILLFLIVS